MRKLRFRESAPLASALKRVISLAFERIGISTRLTIVMCVLVLVTAATSAGLIFTYLDDQLVQSKRLELMRETDLQASNFIHLIEELKHDVRLVATTPLITRLIRARENDGVDPRDGSEFHVLRDRLEIVLSELLRNKEHYLQARFIGVADDGLELVRVERSSEGEPFRAIPKGDLQSKGEEGYFVEAVRRAKGELYLSPINLNREHGEIQKPHTPVLRAMMPVHDSAGSPFGILIINFAVQDTLKSITRVSNPAHHYYVVNARNDYLIHPDPSRNFEFERGEIQRASEDFPYLVEGGGSHLEPGHADHIHFASERVMNQKRVVYGDENSAEWLWIIATSSFGDITAVTALVAQEVLLLILGLITAAAGVGVWLARITTKPIDTLASTVRKMNVEEDELEIPSSLSAEARDLALALKSAFRMARERNRDLQGKNRELERFAYIASHDLQEPIRTITSFVEILNEEHAEDLPSGAEQSLRFITESCVRMRTLVHGLLEYSRLGLETKSEEVDLNETLHDIVQDLNAAIEIKDARIEISSLPTLRLYPMEVRLLFQNLISNAIKFSKPDVPPRIQIQATQEDTGWLFSVTDNGIGIPESDREKVFHIFQRLHNRADYEGTGLGLAHCQKIAEMHHGSIEVEPGPEGGCRFQVQLKPFA